MSNLATSIALFVGAVPWVCIGGFGLWCSFDRSGVEPAENRAAMGGFGVACLMAAGWLIQAGVYWLRRSA